MSLLRVGLGTTMIEPGHNQGRLDGIGVYTRALLDYLPGAGVEVRGFSYPRMRGKLDLVSAGFPMPQSFERALAVDLLSPRAHRVHMPADLFHVTDYRVVRMDCPIVATLHDALPIKYPQWCNPRLRNVKNWLQKKATRKADHVIALSAFAIPELVECFGADENHISVVPCGVADDWAQAPAPAAVQARLAAHGLRPGYFLFVGTLQPRKNVERLIEAYLALPAAVQAQRQLLIVGAPGWRCESLLARIKAAQQNGAAVLWLADLLGHTALREVYAGAGVFVFPSLYEGFGIPIVEAFAAGIPVVASNTSSIPEVSQGAALEVDPLDVGALKAAMLALVQEAPLRAACIAKGLERAQELTWRNTALRTRAVYDAVLSR